MELHLPWLYSQELPKENIVQIIFLSFLENVLKYTNIKELILNLFYYCLIKNKKHILKVSCSNVPEYASLRTGASINFMLCCSFNFVLVNLSYGWSGTKDQINILILIICICSPNCPSVFFMFFLVFSNIFLFLFLLYNMSQLLFFCRPFVGMRSVFFYPAFKIKISFVLLSW